GVRDDQLDVAGTGGQGPEGAFRPDPATLSLPPSFQGPIAPFGVFPPAYTNGKTYYSDGYWARQLYARHLYCLAMLLLPEDPGSVVQYVTNFINSGTPIVPGMPAIMVPQFAYDDILRTTASSKPLMGRRMLIQRIAQWAINCVDFR